MHVKFFKIIFIGRQGVLFLSILITSIILQASFCPVWAEKKIEPVFTLSETVELALDFNSQKHKESETLQSQEIVFLVKKYYYQIQAQLEKLDSAKKVRDHFQKALEKLETVYEEGEEDISQFDITKLKLGLSNTSNDIISLNYALKSTKLHLLMLIGKETSNDFNIVKADIVPVSFLYDNFDIFLKKKNLYPVSRKIEGDIGEASSQIFTKNPRPLDKKNKLILHEAFFKAKEARAKVILGNKNRKITRALLVAEVANYDFGIGDSQDLFEALIIYTRVLSSYVDAVFTLNVAVAELDKLTDTFYR